MAYEMREGQGSLFVNKKKTPGDNLPDRKGDFLLNGVVYEIAGWLRTPKNGGDQFLSLKVSPKDQHSHSRNSGYGNSRPDNTPPHPDETPDW